MRSSLKIALAGAATFSIIVGMAMRSTGQTPPPVQQRLPQDKFEQDWIAIQQAHQAREGDARAREKQERDALPLERPVLPSEQLSRPALPLPEINYPEIAPSTVKRTALVLPPPPPKKQDACTKRGMHRVYYRHRWWCSSEVTSARSSNLRR